MERRTMQLRFLEVGNRRVLQQLYLIDENGKTRQEWRDIPLQKENQKS
jgi:hypothetical protein